MALSKVQLVSDPVSDADRAKDLYENVGNGIVLQAPILKALRREMPI